MVLEKHNFCHCERTEAIFSWDCKVCSKLVLRLLRDFIPGNDIRIILFYKESFSGTLSVEKLTNLTREDKLEQ